MKSETKQIKQAAKALRMMQEKQAKSIKRVRNLHTKLEKASRKMKTLELKTSQLEHQVEWLRLGIAKHETPVTSSLKGDRPLNSQEQILEPADIHIL